MACIFTVLLLGPQVSVFGSPSFSHKEIVDGYEILSDINSGSQTEGYEDVNILSANYLSDGKYLNATLWLAYPLYKYDKPNSTRSYGMLLDADFNNKSGVQGADYRLRIEWKDQTKSWEKVFEQLQTPISRITPFPIPTRVLQIDENYTQVIEQLRENFIELPVDLALMGFPERFRVSFYAQDIGEDSWIVDFTDWISIPSPEVELIAVPNPLVIYQGSYNITEVQIKSAAGYEPHINLRNIEAINGIKSSFIDASSLRVPPHGIASSHLNVTVPKNISETRYTVPIETTLTVSPRSQTSSNTQENEEAIQNSHLLIPVDVENQQIRQQAILSIIIKRPPPAPDPIDIFVSWFIPIGNLIATFVAILSGIAAGVYGIIKYKRAKKQDQESTHTPG